MVTLAALVTGDACYLLDYQRGYAEVQADRRAIGPGVPPRGESFNDQMYQALPGGGRYVSAECAGARHSGLPQLRPAQASGTGAGGPSAGRAGSPNGQSPLPLVFLIQDWERTERSSSRSVDRAQSSCR